MSIAVMTKVWDMDLPAKDKLVLLALADCANDEGLAWPSIATLARKCGCDQRTIQRNLRDLESRGLLRREEVIGKGCRYFVTPRQIATPDKKSPVTKTTKTPGKSPPKPSNNQSVSNETVTIARAAKLPDGWEPVLTAAAQRIVDGWPPGRFEAELAAFRDHAADKGRTSKDWQAAFRTWLTNANRWTRNDNRQQRPQSSGSTATAAAGALAILEGRNAAGSH